MGNFVEDYRDAAKSHEKLFRNILKDLKRRDGICQIDFDPNETIDELFEKYSTGNRYRKFTICDFVVGPNRNGLVELADREALIDVEDMGCMSGVGYSLIYKILESDSIEFKKKTNIRMS